MSNSLGSPAGIRVIVAESEFSRAWFTASHGETTVASTGAAVLDGSAFRKEELATHISRLLSRGRHIGQVIGDLNGQFAVVVSSPDRLIAAVDRVRSIPLFYSQAATPAILTDDVDHIRARIGRTSLDPVQEAFFLKTGYTVDRNTLLKQVYQLVPGEMLTFEDGRIHVDQYFRHFSTQRFPFNESRAFEDLDEVSERVFWNTISILDGRQAVVPLSGGYDSRYIVSGLRKLGYDHIACITYGRKGSPEIETARKVASALGLRWHVIEYRADLWKELVLSEQLSRFLQRSFQWNSLPHIQELLALEKLVSTDAIEDEAVFLPGFCGDLLGGSYVPESLEEDPSGESLLNSPVADYTLARHLILTNCIDSSAADQFRMIVHSSLGDKPTKDIRDFVSHAERWFTEHKVSKFVVNAVRTYEHFGFDWYLPLWDISLLDYWYSVPLKYRVGKRRLYDRYLLEHYFAGESISFEKIPAIGHIISRNKLKNVFGIRITDNARKIFHQISRKSIKRDPNLFFVAGHQLSMLAQRQCPFLKGGHDINSALARFVLGIARNQTTSLNDRAM